MYICYMLYAICYVSFTFEALGDESPTEGPYGNPQKFEQTIDNMMIIGQMAKKLMAIVIPLGGPPTLLTTSWAVCPTTYIYIYIYIRYR